MGAEPVEPVYSTTYNRLVLSSFISVSFHPSFPSGPADTAGVSLYSILYLSSRDLVRAKERPKKRKRNFSLSFSRLAANAVLGHQTRFVMFLDSPIHMYLIRVCMYAGL